MSGDASRIPERRCLELRVLDPAAMERPLFVFVRDSASGMDLALWDCERVPRPRETQCLPGDRAALARLMRSR